MKLAVNRETQEAVAVKIINLEKTNGAEETVRKEVNEICTVFINSVNESY